MSVSQVTTTIVVAAVTLAAYVLALEIRRKWNSPFANPVLIATPLVVGYLLLTHISYAEYGPAKNVLTALLGPATVALAAPLYRNREIFVAHLASAGIGLVFGSLATMIACGTLARAFALPPSLIASLSIKSATAPIAIEIAKSFTAIRLSPRCS